MGVNKGDTLTLIELQTAHPYGEYSERNGCYYTLDYDQELGYFRQLTDGTFESDWNWVDFDTLPEDDVEYILDLAKKVSLRM